MKTYKNLFTQIITFDNFLSAATKSSKGRKYNADVVQFHFKKEDEIFKLQEELKNKTYKPGAYRTFNIYDPKERMISAAPYRDRVVHHALCNIIEPIFDRTFIFDSYANRTGKGTHKAIERYQVFAKQHEYVLKCDIRKFFPSLDLAILKQEIRWKIACPDTLWLIDLIIDNSNLQEEHTIYFPDDDLFTPYERRHGLPIGNLTSQFWANVYLNRFDHFIQEKLGVPYIRYVDDFVLFSKSKEILRGYKKLIDKHLASLRLITHPTKSKIYRVADGVPFLGFKIYPIHRIVKKQGTRRFKRHLKNRIQEWKLGQLQPDKLESGLNAWLGHVRFGISRKLEYNVFWKVRHAGVSLCTHPRCSWRVLEQQQ
jgi:RNA-directed DNA polymerase